eukprot:PhM_4_TR16547/c0_g1_i1/m.44163
MDVVIPTNAVHIHNTACLGHDLHERLLRSVRPRHRPRPNLDRVLAVADLKTDAVDGVRRKRELGLGHSPRAEVLEAVVHVARRGICRERHLPLAALHVIRVLPFGLNALAEQIQRQPRERRVPSGVGDGLDVVHQIPEVFHVGDGVQLCGDEAAGRGQDAVQGPRRVKGRDRVDDRRRQHPHWRERKRRREGTRGGVVREPVLGAAGDAALSLRGAPGRGGLRRWRGVFKSDGLRAGRHRRADNIRGCRCLVVVIRRGGRRERRGCVAGRGGDGHGGGGWGHRRRRPTGHEHFGVDVGCELQTWS